MLGTFDRAIEFIFQSEGGFTDDPHDSGGATRYGISQRSHPGLNIKDLTREQAVELYKKEYWDRCRCSELPAQLALILMDAAVNQGPARAIGMLQRSLGVRPDSVVGPETISAAQRADLRPAIVDFIARRNFAYGQHPEFLRYGLGWCRRAAACHQITAEPL